MFLHPIPTQLWFVRNLFALVILSPVIYFLIKHLKFYIVGALLIAWFIEVEFYANGFRSVAFYFTGAYIGINNIKITNLKISKTYIILPIIWFLLVLIKTHLKINGDESLLTLSLLHKASVLFGIASIWTNYDLIFKDNITIKPKMFAIFKYSFFIYIFHDPLLTVIKNWLYFSYGESESTLFIIYIIAPIITLVIVLSTGRSIKMYIPKLYKIITGNR